MAVGEVGRVDVCASARAVLQRIARGAQGFGLLAGLLLMAISPAGAQYRRPVMIAWINADTSPFGGAGAKFAFGRPVDDPGPMLMIAGGTDGAMALAGYQQMIQDAHAFVGVGPEYRSNRGVGVRGHLELWARPFPTLSASVVLSCGTAKMECWSRSRIGFRLSETVHLGPESVIATDRLGVGLALTGLAVGPLTMEAAGGIERPWRGRFRSYASMALIGRF